jgi:hypothetical protein
MSLTQNRDSPFRRESPQEATVTGYLSSAHALVLRSEYLRRYGYFR